MTLPNIYLKNLVLPPLTELLGHPVKNIVFALITKNFLQTLDHYFSGIPWENKMKFFTYEVLSIKIG